MDLTTCPLGYECEKTAECTRFGYGLDEEALARTKNTGLIVSDLDNTPMLELCSGPVKHGLNGLASAALAAHPVLREEGFEAAVAGVKRVSYALGRASSQHTVTNCACKED